MDELGCEFLTVVAYKKESVIEVYTGRCVRVDFKSIATKLKKMDLKSEEVKEVIVFELRDEEFIKVGTYRM